jgi:hypothetical protein
MSLDITQIKPCYKDAPMIKDPICAALVATDEEYRDAYNKRNFRDQSTLDTLSNITTRRFQDMARVADIEANQSTDDEIIPMLYHIKIALKDEADSCLRHGMIKECAAALRASCAIYAIIKRYQINKE